MTPPPDEFDQLLAQLDITTVPTQHLPLVAAVAEQVGITEALSALFPKDVRTPVSDAQCVVALLCHILSRSQRVALYRTQHWLEQTDTALLFGSNIRPGMFSDQRLAATLDRLVSQGTDEVMSLVATTFLRRHHDKPAWTLHLDTTSLRLFGAYDGLDEQWTQPMPARGFSKDHRPDLKQLVYGMGLHSPTGVPLFAHTADGNTSDTELNRLGIEQLASCLPPHDDVTFVADSKLCDPVTLGQLLFESFHFITLLPRTYGLRRTLVQLVAEQEQLPELARSPGETQSSPDKVYAGRSFTMPFGVQVPRDGSKEVKLRFLVVRSSTLGARFEASLADKLTTEAKRFRKKARNEPSYQCEADARQAAERLDGTLKLHRASFDVQRIETPHKRPRPGRPPKGQTRPTEVSYKLVLIDLEVDEARVEQARRLANHFVLVSDHLDDSAWPDARLLSEYREQHQVEGGFRWLKGPAAVAPLLLKTPERIAAMGLVFTFALMVRNYIQHVVRHKLVEREEELPYYGTTKRTAAPTAEVVFDCFVRVQLEVVRVGERVVRRKAKSLNEDALRILDMLGLEPDIFSRFQNEPCSPSQPTE